MPYEYRYSIFLTTEEADGGAKVEEMENPYYGLRKPREQLNSSPFFVSDLLIVSRS